MTKAVTNRGERGGEQGYLLLVVVALLALLLIAMAVAAPKIKDAIRRDHEFELQHRGMQYARGIKLYYKKFSAYPTNINQLMNTNNIKFLRKKYRDPITGNQVWRPVYFGQVGTGGNINPNCSTSGGSFNGSAGGGNSIFGSSGGSSSFGNSGSSFGNSGSSLGSSNGGGSGPSFGSSGSSGFGSTPGTTGTDCNGTSTSGTNGTNGQNGNQNGNQNGPGSGNNVAANGTNANGTNGTGPAAYPYIGPDTEVPDPAGFKTPLDSFGGGALGNTVAGGGFGSSTTNSSTFGGTGGTAGAGGAAVGGIGSGGQIVGVASLSHKESILSIKGKNHYNDLEFIYDPTKDYGGFAGLTGTGVGGGTQAPGAFGSPSPPFGSPSGNGFGSSGIGGQQGSNPLGGNGNNGNNGSPNNGNNGNGNQNQ